MHLVMEPQISSQAWFYLQSAVISCSIDKKHYLKTIKAIASYSNSDPTVAKMAVGALIGAGIFVVCVVAGACMIIVPFEPANWPLTRDIVTYMWAVYWLIYCMWKGEISLFDAIGFLVYYFIYVAVVVIWSKFGPKKNKISPNGELAEKNEVPGTPASLRSQSKNRVRSGTMCSYDFKENN